MRNCIVLGKGKKVGSNLSLGGFVWKGRGYQLCGEKRRGAEAKLLLTGFPQASWFFSSEKYGGLFEYFAYLGKRRQAYWHIMEGKVIHLRGCLMFWG